MNNKKYRPRLSVIEMRMIVTDMEKRAFYYDERNSDSHREIINKFKRYM